MQNTGSGGIRAVSIGLSERLIRVDLLGAVLFGLSKLAKLLGALAPSSGGAAR